jgi:hypothetical protein
MFVVGNWRLPKFTVPALPVAQISALEPGPSFTQLSLLLMKL